MIVFEYEGMDFRTALALAEKLSDTTHKRILDRFIEIVTQGIYNDKRDAFVVAVYEQSSPRTQGAVSTGNISSFLETQIAAIKKAKKT